ncbi:MAG: AAA family ATPase [Candidatus Aureabacteria bacterium]|nr:AAA family ATPase [Candidatus Auribacterota bacterium]
MYESYWKLKEKPFRNTPDPKFFFSSNQHEDSLLKLTYAAAESMGAAMLTGVFGCGKTLIGQSLIKNLGEERYRLAFINNPQLSSQELLRSIVRSLKATQLPTKMTEIMSDALLEVLQEILLDNMRDGKETIVIIDEAHIIKDDDVFETLRLLLNFQLQNKFLVTLFLFGQPELRDKVNNYKQLEQRIALRCHLDRFNEKETSAYIQHRLKIAGRENEIFTPEALKLIHEKTGGIPRRINHLCDLSLLTGFGRKTEKINPDVIQKSSKEFGS